MPYRQYRIKNIIDTINIVLFLSSASLRLWLASLFLMMGWEMSIETTFKWSSIKVAQSHFSAQHGAKPKPPSKPHVKGEQMG